MFCKLWQRPKSLAGILFMKDKGRKPQRKQWEGRRRWSMMEKFGDLSQLLRCSLSMLFFLQTQREDILTQMYTHCGPWSNAFLNSCSWNSFSVFVCGCKGNAGVTHLWMLPCKCDTTSVSVSVCYGISILVRTNWTCKLWEFEHFWKHFGWASVKGLFESYDLVWGLMLG